VAHKAERVHFPHGKKRDYSGGPVPDLHGVPFYAHREHLTNYLLSKLLKIRIKVKGNDISALTLEKHTKKLLAGSRIFIISHGGVFSLPGYFPWLFLFSIHIVQIDAVWFRFL